MGEFGKKLGKLSLAILENFVEKNLGEKFVDELRLPTDRALAIQTALENVEDRFQKEFDDKDLYHSIFIGLPIDKTKLSEAIGKFFDRPTDSDFPKMLTQLITHEYEKLSQTRVDNSVSFYIKVLKQELALADDEFREKIKALTDLETLEYIKEISKNLKPPDTKSETNLKKEAVNLPIYAKDSNVHPVGDLPLGSHLPFSPNALFTGREKELKKLADSILGESKTNTVITQAVTGMGGLGKTQLAIEFGYRYGKYFRGVHWINLADPTQLDSEIANCGRQIFTQDFPEDQPTQVALTLQTWKENGPNLLILDNFEEPSKANDVLTKLRHSNIRVLVTSRRMDWSQTLGLTQLPLDLFSEEESLQFLKNSLKSRKDSEEDLKNLAERLGHLPLGLELASRYLNGHARLSISDYLKQTENALDHASMKNWRADMPAATGHDLDLQKTFALSWQEIKDETVKKILMMSGYLAPNTPIPLEVFENALDISQEECDLGLTILYGLGLLRPNESEHINLELNILLPSIHPLLGDYVRFLAKIEPQILESLSDAFLFLSIEADQGELPVNSLPILATHAEPVNQKSAGIIWTAYGRYLRDIADYDSAHIAYTKALKIYKSAYGENHQNTASLLNDIGNLFFEQGKIFESRIYLEQALKSYEVVFGKDDPEITSSLNNLGIFLLETGDLLTAKKVFKRSLKIDETNFGLNNPKVATDLSNLGMVMKNLGELSKAQKMLGKSLRIDETAFGPMHPNVATRLNNLAMIFSDKGDLNGARSMFERALKIDETNFGLNHPKVAIDSNNLGTVMQELGDLNGARSMFERALKIDETNFGPNHSNIAIRVNNLGRVMQAIGDLKGAKTMYERAINIWESNFEVEHPQIANSINNLGSILQAMGDLNGAKEMYEHALKIDEANFGVEHPNVAIRINNLGMVLKDLGDLQGGKEMLERALEIFKKFLPADHPNIKGVQSNLDLFNKSK